MDLLDTLQSIGLTQYESKTFIALVSNGSNTPFQISKISGIPRARIYDTLDSLVDKGLAMREVINDGSKIYQSIPIDVFLERQRQKWNDSYQVMENKLKILEKQKARTESYVSTVQGEGSILSFCKTLIHQAEHQIMLSIWNPMYQELLPDLQEKAEKGCQLRGIAFEVDNPIAELIVHRKNTYMASLSSNKWFILSVDSRKLLYGHAAEKNENAFYTDDSVHIFLLEDYIWHDVLVNRLVEKGEQNQLDSWILPEMEKFFGKRMIPRSLWDGDN